MASGGARARSGPPPDPDALRRDRKNDAAKWITLPVEGRNGPTPDWPLSGRAAHISALTSAELQRIKDEDEKQRLLDQIESEASARFARELEVWGELWSTPQAKQWERNGQELEVAVFVRTFVEAEAPGAAKGRRDLVRQGMEALGLSVPGLARNHWKIGKAEAAEDSPKSAPKARAARSRFKVINGDGEST